MTSHKWFFIINPISGGGGSKKVWPRIAESLDQQEIRYKSAFTEHHKHSVDLVHYAVNQGFKSIIGVGGDGTFHNIINGLMTQSECKPDDVNLGLIPVGTGNDWIRTYGIPKDYKKALQVLINGETKQQDIGKITLGNSNNEIVYFNNLAGVGFDGHVAKKVNKYKNFGSAAYLIGAITGLFTFENVEVKIVINQSTIQSKSLMVLVGLCKYSGGGMRLTHSPNPIDGLFDISLAKNFSKSEIIKNLNRLFNGNIVKHRLVENFKAAKLTLSVQSKNLPYIQADGELIGRGGFDAEIIPKAINFYC